MGIKEFIHTKSKLYEEPYKDLDPLVLLSVASLYIRRAIVKRDDYWKWSELDKAEQIMRWQSTISEFIAWLSTDEEFSTEKSNLNLYQTDMKHYKPGDHGRYRWRKSDSLTSFNDLTNLDKARQMLELAARQINWNRVSYQDRKIQFEKFMREFCETIDSEDWGVSEYVYND